ncbi:MAG: hypothetical protein RQ745_07760 [Longimicrobiales bacterium]|nr:hypothetical protein [Longimicrobiales bacterium]
MPASSHTHASLSGGLRRIAFGCFVFLLLPAACVGTHYETDVEPPGAAMLAPADAPGVRTRIDTERREVVMVAGPFTIPSGPMNHGGGMAEGGHGEHDEGMKTPLIPLEWPVKGGLRGFRLALFQKDGTRLSRELVHHLNALHFDRRELIYPIPTRLIAVGSETPDILLPESHQIRMAEGDSIGWYIMWHNDTGRAIEDVYVEFALPYADPPAAGATALTSLYLDTNFTVGEDTSFDVPPGRSERSHDFEVPTGGTILAAGGHVHDYGVEVRLEEVETGRVIVRLEADRDAEGRVASVEQKIFRRFFGLFESGVRLEPGRTYRVVGVYDNPTGAMIPGGGMAQIGALFRPDSPADWPVNDPGDPRYRLDRSGIPEPISGHGAHGH